MITAKNSNMRLYYDGRISDAITIQSVGLKLGMTFYPSRIPRHVSERQERSLEVHARL